MKILAATVHPDEGCWGLFEGPRHVPYGKGTQERWVQAVYVIRGDAIAEWTQDFGPIEDWPDATPIIYPSFGENSVGELQFLAERDRHDDKWARRRKEMKAESTLIKDILRQEEQKIQIVANRSVVGPAVTKQRNEFPREAAASAYKERLKDARSR